MKQELCRADSKASSPMPSARGRVPRLKESPAAKCSANGVSSPESKKRTKPASLEAASANGVRRPILLSKLKPAAVDEGEAPKERDVEGPGVACLPRNRAAEQYARTQRRTDAGARKPEKETTIAKEKELQSRLDASERLVAELRNEVVALKGQLQRLEGRNVELELQNRKLVGDLSAAEVKIRTSERRDQVDSSERKVHQSANGDAQKLVDNDERIIAEKDVHEDRSLKLSVRPVEGQPQVQSKKTSPSSTTGHSIVRLPPPPLPPPLPACHRAAKANVVDKAYPLVELYRSLTRRDGKKDAMVNGVGALNNNTHNSIVGELQNRSAHLLAVSIREALFFLLSLRLTMRVTRETMVIVRATNVEATETVRAENLEAAAPARANAPLSLLRSRGRRSENAAISKPTTSLAIWRLPTKRPRGHDNETRRFGGRTTRRGDLEAGAARQATWARFELSRSDRGELAEVTSVRSRS